MEPDVEQQLQQLRQSLEDERQHRRQLERELQRHQHEQHTVCSELLEVKMERDILRRREEALRVLLDTCVCSWDPAAGARIMNRQKLRLAAMTSPQQQLPAYAADPGGGNDGSAGGGGGGGRSCGVQHEALCQPGARSGAAADAAAGTGGVASSDTGSGRSGSSDSGGGASDGAASEGAGTIGSDAARGAGAADDAEMRAGASAANALLALADTAIGVEQAAQVSADASPIDSGTWRSKRRRRLPAAGQAGTPSRLAHCSAPQADGQARPPTSEPARQPPSGGSPGGHAREDRAAAPLALGGGPAAEEAARWAAVMQAAAQAAAAAAASDAADAWPAPKPVVTRSMPAARRGCCPGDQGGDSLAMKPDTEGEGARLAATALPRSADVSAAGAPPPAVCFSTHPAAMASESQAVAHHRFMLALHQRWPLLQLGPQAQLQLQPLQHPQHDAALPPHRSGRGGRGTAKLCNSCWNARRGASRLHNVWPRPCETVCAVCHRHMREHTQRCARPSN